MLDHPESRGPELSAPYDRIALDFSVRVSRRAHRVRLTVSPRDGLVVVVPAGWRGDPAAIVASKLQWAERALSAVADKRAQYLAGSDALLPDVVDLAAIGRRLTVDYRSSGAATVSARSEGASVIVSGAVDDADACVNALRRWLTRTAREELFSVVRSESARTGLQPTTFRVTSAKTRWGSCSARGSLSLHRNALFLPQHLARALVLHELAHLRIMDHSPRFWSFLASLDPHALEHRAQLRQAGDLVPAWADV